MTFDDKDQTTLQVVCGDILKHPELLHQADVIVAHSVVDFFLPEEDHATFWTFIHENTRRKGLLLVTTPSLEKAIGHLKVRMFLFTHTISLKYLIFFPPSMISDWNRSQFLGQTFDFCSL